MCLTQRDFGILAFGSIDRPGRQSKRPKGGYESWRFAQGADSRACIICNTIPNAETRISEHRVERLESMSERIGCCHQRELGPVHSFSDLL
jgi:hypothetical protein